MPPFLIPYIIDSAYGLCLLIIALRVIKRIFSKHSIKYCFFGPIGSGKTTLYNILSTGIPGDPNPTQIYGESHESITLHVYNEKGEPVELTLDKTVDHTGEQSKQEELISQTKFENYDFLVLLFNLDEFFEYPEERKNVIELMDTMAVKLNECKNKKDKVVLLLGTYKDDDQSKSAFNGLSKKTIKSRLKKELVDHPNNASTLLPYFAAGNLKDDKFANDIKKQLLGPFIEKK